MPCTCSTCWAFHLGHHCPYHTTARQVHLEPVLYELRSFFESPTVFDTDKAQWNACLGGIVSDDPSICTQCRHFWLGPLKKDNKDNLSLGTGERVCFSSTHLGKSSIILVKSRPAMPRVDASPRTTALVIHPTNRPLSRVLFLFRIGNRPVCWSCWLVHFLFIHLLFLTIGHVYAPI